ncbi:MAG: T9SS type A sorting domain-containing protein [Sphingobacteriales bacterium]|nr:MAG: T9SS type A sorting domain-containing protein [Sphingobacteriales bacterium]
MRTSTAALAINNLPPGTIKAPSQILPIQVTGSADIAHIQIIVGNPDFDVSSFDFAAASATYNYSITSNTYGRINIYAIGTDNTGSQVMDSTYVIVSPTATITGLTLTPSSLTLIKGRPAAFKLEASYSDGVKRDVTNESTNSFSFSDPTVAVVSPNKTNLVGLRIGESVFTVTFKGVPATGYVEVIDSSNIRNSVNTARPVVVKDGYAIDSANLINCFNNTRTACFDVYSTKAVTFSIAAMPLNGNLVLSPGSKSFCVTYTPTLGFSGSDKAKINVCDATGNCTEFPLNYFVKHSLEGFPVLQRVDTLQSSIIGSKYTWYADNTILPNDTLFAIVRTTAHNYKVLVTDENGCVGTSALFSINPLPLHLGTLSLTKATNVINLHWKVDEEQDVARYEVYHSTNGADYRMVSTAVPKNNRLNQDYDFAHVNYNIGKNYYQVKLVKTSGAAVHTNVASIVVTDKTQLLIRPNPVGSILTATIQSSYNGSAVLTMIDNAGKCVWTKKVNVVKGANAFNVPVSFLAQGAYYLHINGDGENRSVPFVKE